MHPFYSSHWPRFWQGSRRVLMVFMMLATFQVAAQTQGKERPVQCPTFYRTIQVDGLSIFYRDAGSKDAPTLLLLQVPTALYCVAHRLLSEERNSAATLERVNPGFPRVTGKPKVRNFFRPAEQFEKYEVRGIP